MNTTQTPQAAAGARRQSPAQAVPVKPPSRERVRELLGWNMLPAEGLARQYSRAY